MDCPSVLMIKGKAFPCDEKTVDENGRHDGWGHASGEAEAVWFDDRRKPVMTHRVGPAMQNEDVPGARE